MWPTLITSILPGLIDKLFPDPAKADEAKLNLLKLQQDGALKELEAATDLARGQLEVNKAEASSGNVSGTRIPCSSAGICWIPTRGR